MQKKENRSKIIFHIDMNAFFCSVACVLNPSLRGTAFAIGRENSYRGVLSTASYEARKYGIGSAMSLVEAYKRLPSLLVIHIDYKKYQEFHNRFMEVIRSYTDIVEVASIDEVYADVTELSKTRHPLVIANEIQTRILAEVGIPCSIGIAPTLFLAKMASDMKKPLGITVLRKRDIKEVLYPMSVKDIWGIGKKTHPRLIENGIDTIEKFVDDKNKDLVLSLVGSKQYETTMKRLTGNSSNVVKPDRWSKSSSISHSETYDEYKTSVSDAILEIRKMTRKVYSRMINEGYYTKTVIITLRDSNFDTITRRITLEDYTDDFDLILDAAISLCEQYFDNTKSYRLLGIGVASLVLKNELPKEYNLFTISDFDEKEAKLKNIMHDFNEKYGKKALYFKKDEKNE